MSVLVQKLPVNRIEAGALLVKIFLKYLHNTFRKPIITIKVCIISLFRVVMQMLLFIILQFGEMV